MAGRDGWGAIADYMGGLSNSNALVQYLQMIPQATQAAASSAWAPLAQGYEAIDAVDQQQRAAHPTMARVSDALGLLTMSAPSVGMLRTTEEGLLMGEKMLKNSIVPRHRVPGRYYHVTDSERPWDGGDLLSYDSQVDSGRKVPRWKWEEVGAGNDPSSGYVSLHRSLTDAENHISDFGGSEILAVDIPTENEIRMRINHEGFPAVVERIPLEYVSKFR